MRFVDPKTVATQFHIRDGDAVGDFGAGCGHFTKVLSLLTGSGKVYAFEIQKQLTQKIAELARTEHLSNVHVVWCDLEESNGTKLDAESLDIGIMVNTLFQIEDKAQALEEVARVVRKGGKFFVVDWSDSFGGVGPQPSDIMTEETVKEFASQHGFSFERTFPSGEHHYGLAFRRS